MNPRTRVYVCILGVAVLIFVINMLRTRRLQERYALLWILAGATLTIAPWFAPWFDRWATALGFDYAPALLLMLAVIGLLLLIFQLSLNVTSHSEHLKVLTQELGLLHQEVLALSARLAAGAAAQETAISAPQEPPADIMLSEAAVQDMLRQVTSDRERPSGQSLWEASPARETVEGGTR